MVRGLSLPVQSPGGIWRMVAALALVTALLGMVAALPQGAAAANCTVVNTNDAGAGSLRAAINNSDNFTNCDTIDFNLPGAAPWTITLTTGQLSISRNLIITGPGAANLTVSGNNASRVFLVTAGTVNINDLTAANGNAGPGEGGGIYSAATLNIARATIRDNSADLGGGITNAGGTMTVTDSTVIGNTGGIAYGGFYNYDGTTTLTNCTITGNTGSFGAGIYTLNSNFGSNNAVTTVTHCTVSGNTGIGFGVSSNRSAPATIRVGSSIFAGNTGRNFSTFGPNTRVSLGYNVISDSSGGSFLTATGDLNDTNPLLATLGNYGGPTQTRALLPGSPAIDRVPATGANCPATDQRGIARPQTAGLFCDSGAFESRGFTLALTSGNNQSAVINTAFANPLVVTVSSSNAEPVEGGVVTFTGPGSGADIQGTPLTATVAANGQASRAVTANGTVGGPYTVTAAARGAAPNIGFSLTNLIVPTTLVAAPATGVYTGTVTLSATLSVTGGGAGIAGKTIAFTLNGASVGSAATDGSGVAQLANVSLAGINAGSYPAGVGASFAGDATTAAVSNTAALTVNKATTALTQVRGDATYGDTTGSVTATLRRTNGDGGPVVGATVQFTINGTPVGSATTNAQGVAVLAGVALPAGLNAGSIANAVGASYAGDGNHLAAGPTRGPLVLARRILWVKPTDRTVVLNQPNPPTTPPAGCVAQQTPTSACWLELANGSAFVNGDDWGDLNLGALRFSYSRNPPATNATEYEGKTYRITAFGAVSSNYDLRYQQGTLTVVR